MEFLVEFKFVNQTVIYFFISYFHVLVLEIICARNPTELFITLTCFIYIATTFISFIYNCVVMKVPPTSTSSGQKRPKKANKSKYELYSNAIKASINSVIYIYICVWMCVSVCVCVCVLIQLISIVNKCHFVCNEEVIKFESFLTNQPLHSERWFFFGLQTIIFERPCKTYRIKTLDNLRTFCLLHH